MKSMKLNQKGDTIVEVLIAMVILAFVLTGAYESSQYSLNNIINSENRITAINLASSQIEELKSWIANPMTPYNFNSNFYMNEGAPESITSPAIYENFLYEFTSPQQESLSTNPNNTNYTFTVNVYWRNLNTDTLSHECNAQNLSNCDNISVSYRSAI